MPLIQIIALAIVLFVAQGCRTAAPEKQAERSPLEQFYPEKLTQIDALIETNIAQSHLPGGVLWLERKGVAYHKPYGLRAVVPQHESMTEDTIFDAASLTKVIATTSAILVLAQDGKINLNAPAAKYLPGFEKNGKGEITVRQLMTHISGLRPDLSLTPEWSGYDKGIELACEEKLVTKPGTTFRYSDINFIVLGEIVHRVSGQPLNEFVATHIFGPLKMKDSGFLPPVAKINRIAPTEKIGETVLRGIVHDPTARRMGGVAGHAGLFTTASDLARFSRCLLNGGELDGVRVFKPETMSLMKTVQTPEEIPARRALGWDLDSPFAGPRGKYFPIGSFGHTGWTGTSIWIDPFSDTFVIFLSNRNHPDESGNVVPLRRELGTLAAEAIRDFNFSYVPGALAARESTPEVKTVRTRQVLNGIDILKRNRFAQLRGLKIGLITNHTGTDNDRNPTIDLLHEADGVQLVTLFSPEHGIRGLMDEKIGDSKDAKTGLPIYSLYGARRAPTDEQLANLDALVFDIQDIGCRFYTYISTMGNCMEVAARNKKKYFVLDRVNPINGVDIEGPVLKGERSFTGWHNIPVRYGMTIGELARMFNNERQFKADLTVVPVTGWSRDMFFDQTMLPWINQSPNMRSLTEAILYPGIGLLETTALSVGRGTDTPFEVIGAPYIDDLKLSAELNRAGLPGVRFVPIRFTPNASVYKDKLCKGVNIILTDRENCNVVDVGIEIARKLQQLYPKEFGLDKFNRLLVHQPTIEAIRSGKSLQELKNLWSTDLNDFRTRRDKYLLYK